MRAELLRHEDVMRILGGGDLNFVVAVNNSLSIHFVGDKRTGQAMVRSTKLEVIVGHHVDEAEIMVRVQMGKEDGSNPFRWNSNLYQALDSSDATVD